MLVNGLINYFILIFIDVILYFLNFLFINIRDHTKYGWGEWDHFQHGWGTQPSVRQGLAVMMLSIAVNMTKLWRKVMEFQYRLP